MVISVEKTPRRQTAGKPARRRHKWTEEELQYFSDHYGIISDETLARNLNRSGLGYVAKKLGLKRRDNFYTASELGRVLGVDAQTIVKWFQLGFLRGTKAPIKTGMHRLWRFTHTNIIAFLRQYPWLIDLDSMPEHYFRSVVRREWERDPWYTCGQASPLLGVKAETTVRDYVVRGWLPAIEKPHGGVPGRAWVIKDSSVQAFLANDPRPESNHSTISEGRHRFLLESGQAAKVAIAWLTKCPSCGQQVEVTAPPHLLGSEVRERFIALHNGNCAHGSHCQLPTETPKGFSLSRETRARRRRKEADGQQPNLDMTAVEFSRLLSKLCQDIAQAVVDQLVNLKGPEHQSYGLVLDCGEPAPKLTHRQLKVFDYMAKGYLNKQIALELHYSVSEIKRIVALIIKKMDTTSRTHAVVKGIEQGILCLPITEGSDEKANQ